MYKPGLFQRKRVYFLQHTLPFARIFSVERRWQNETIHVGVMVNKDGSLQATLMFRGPDLDSAIEEQLAIITIRLNALFASIGTGRVLFFEAQRVLSTNYANDVYFPDPITKAIDLERKTLFSGGQHFESNYYATLWCMPSSESEERLKHMVIEGREKKQIDEKDALDSFFELFDKIFSIFSDKDII
ncbi:MAG: hypothetical protein ACTTH3_04260 [Schwartzia sp. (in: firmicutes)]